MASVHDVAKYILKKLKCTTHMKLQKLVYYCQAWSLVWEERPLFKNKIEAWANGPVVPALYQSLKGYFNVLPKNLRLGDPSNLSPNDKETIDAVLDFYDEKPSQYLSDLTHMERPWQEARKGLGPGEHGSREITLASMAEYYGSL